MTRLAELLATPWGKKGGRTVAISPGLIDTPMGRTELDRQEIIPVMIEVTPVKRPDRPLPGRPEDIAAAVAFLSPMPRHLSPVVTFALTVDSWARAST